MTPLDKYVLEDCPWHYIIPALPDPQSPDELAGVGCGITGEPCEPYWELCPRIDKVGPNLYYDVETNTHKDTKNG